MFDLKEVKRDLIVMQAPMQWTMSFILKQKINIYFIFITGKLLVFQCLGFLCIFVFCFIIITPFVTLWSIDLILYYTLA